MLNVTEDITKCTSTATEIQLVDFQLNMDANLAHKCFPGCYEIALRREPLIATFGPISTLKAAY